MPDTIAVVIPLLALTFLVAFVYSSVGHGGASGYLALLAFFAAPHDLASTSALGLNLLVSGTAFLNFRKANHFSWKLTWPFLVTSIPAAFLGGTIRIPPSAYFLLLAFVLVFAAFRLVIEVKPAKGVRIFSSLLISLIVGGTIGFLSGMIGIGGGIFLSPLLVLLNWASPHGAASSSAFFIFVNSSAGLLGRFFSHRLGIIFPVAFVFLIGVAFLGGILGSYFGARRFSGLALRKILAFVLLLASCKLLVSL